MLVNLTDRSIVDIGPILDSKTCEADLCNLVYLKRI